MYTYIYIYFGAILSKWPLSLFSHNNYTVLIYTTLTYIFESDNKSPHLWSFSLKKFLGGKRQEKQSHWEKIYAIYATGKAAF